MKLAKTKQIGYFTAENAESAEIIRDSVYPVNTGTTLFFDFLRVLRDLA
jgi:hypothetical protein